jgi:hypothetical protein
MTDTVLSVREEIARKDSDSVESEGVDDVGPSCRKGICGLRDKARENNDSVQMLLDDSNTHAAAASGLDNSSMQPS